MSQKEVSPRFKWAYLGVLGLTLASLVTNIALILAFGQDLPPYAEALLETCSTTWKMGFGAFVGLLGGKNLQKILLTHKRQPFTL